MSTDPICTCSHGLGVLRHADDCPVAIERRRPVALSAPSEPVVVYHWPIVAEAYCVDSGRAVRHEAGDRCIRHGDRGVACTTAVRTPGKCDHQRLSPNHPRPVCSECGLEPQSVEEPVQDQPRVPHNYLSTSCLHGHHNRCGVKQAERGEDGAPHCKFCPAPCGCPCHQEATDG